MISSHTDIWYLLHARINTLRPRQMDAISQTTFSNAFSWMKMFKFQLKFHWSLFLRFQLTIFQHWFRYWLGAVQATSHYLNQWWLVYWRIYASLGLNELTLLHDSKMGPRWHLCESVNFVTMIQAMACPLFSAKRLLKPVVASCQLHQ